MSLIQEIPLNEGTDFIELCDLLKHAGLASSGGAAKHTIAEGTVKVDGAVETRKRCKIRLGQVVTFEGQSVKVVPPKLE